MSYNKGKNYLKKQKKNQSINNNKSLNPFQKIQKMFGNPNTDKFFGIGGKSTENTLKFILEGEKEFQKVIKSLKKDYLLEKLQNLRRINPEMYTMVVEVFLFTPYKKFGNKSKVWFNDFYEFISKLPETETISKNELVPVYRVMTKSEFMKNLNQGVQNPSWTLDLGIVMRFLKKNLLTMDENIVVVKSIFTSDEVSFSPTTVIEGESEVWIRTGSKSIRTFVIGEYTKSQYLTQFDYSKMNDDKLSSFREIMSGSNGYGSDSTDNLRESMLSGSHDDVLYKFTNDDLPKLVRKVKRDKVIQSLGEFNNSLETILGSYIDSYKKVSSGITPLTV